MIQFPHYSLKELYYEFLMPLYHKYREIEKRGIKVDFNQRKKLDDSYSILLKEKHDLLNILAEKEINYNSNAGRNGQVPHLIFVQLGCPIRASVDDETLTALKLNVLKKSSKWALAIRIIDLVLECRKIHKTLNTYIRFRSDPDGRARTNYSLVKETGRTSTSILKPPVRHIKYGLAFQTITKYAEFGKDIRSMLIPDNGKWFVEVDQSQAEARVVMLLAEDYKILDKMNDPKFDLHVLTSSWIWPEIFKQYKIDDFYFKREAKTILQPNGEPYRQRGKKARHAGHYDEGATKLALDMKVGVNVAKLALTKFHENSPNIRGIFHKGIQDALLIDKKLSTPIGRIREFYEKWGDKLFKEAYAQIPQSSVSDLTKWAMMQSMNQGIEVIIESHDSFTYQIEPERLDWSLGVIKPFMESEIDFSTCSLPRGKISIPMETKVYKENLEKGENYVK